MAMEGVISSSATLLAECLGKRTAHGGNDKVFERRRDCMSRYASSVTHRIPPKSVLVEFGKSAL